MRDKDTVAVSKIPLLGDIPVLGWLFKNTRRTVEKVNLLFFLTPRILSDYRRDSSAQMRDLLNRRSGQLKEAVGDDDPFASAVKGLYDKAVKQGETPDPVDNFNSEEEAPPEEVPEEELEMAPSSEEDLAQHSFEVPDYAAIVRNVNDQKEE